VSNNSAMKAYKGPWGKRPRILDMEVGRGERFWLSYRRIKETYYKLTQESKIPTYETGILTPDLSLHSQWPTYNTRCLNGETRIICLSLLILNFVLKLSSRTKCAFKSSIYVRITCFKISRKTI